MTENRQIQELLNFSGKNAPVVSLYLNTDLRHTTLPEIRLITKNLIKERSEELKNTPLTHQEWSSLNQDFERIQQFVEQKLSPGESQGCAIFSNNRADFWQIYFLPQRVKNALIVDPDPYIRPLMAILHQYYKFALVIVDRRRAQIFESYLGQIADQSEFVSEDVPAKVRLAGWYGLEEKRVMRHIDYHVHMHFKKVAAQIYRLSTQHQWDYIILSGPTDILPEFEFHLHRQVQDRIIERLNIQPYSYDVKRIKETLSEIENRFMFERLSKMVELLITDAHKKSRAVLGLENVLKAANTGNIRVLLIQEDTLFPGRECLTCGFLSIQDEICPVCGNTTEKMHDLYDEIVENTIHFNGEFYQVPKGTRLDEFDGIGAHTRWNLEI